MVPGKYHSEWKLVAVFQFLGKLDFSLSVLVATSSGKYVIMWDASLSLGTLTELGKRIFFQSEKNFPEGILRMLETFVKVFVWLLSYTKQKVYAYSFLSINCYVQCYTMCMFIKGYGYYLLKITLTICWIVS